MMVTKNIRGEKTWQFKGRKAIEWKTKLQCEQQPWKSMGYTCPISLIIVPFSVVSSRIDLWNDESIEIQGQVHGLCDEITLFDKDECWRGNTLLYYKTKRLKAFCLEQFISAASCKNKLFCFVLLIF